MSDLSYFLHSHGIRLNTDLGQHFLQDTDVLRTILETATIKPTDHVVEIGPGIGVLTVELLKRARKVMAIELDQTLIPLLNTYVTNNSCPAKPWRSRDKLTTNNLSVVQGNALTVPFPTSPYKIVANIPYHITSPLLRHAFLESETSPTTMTLLIQREVAEKICDTRDYGLLTILVRLFGAPRLIRTVPPEAFIPSPKVDSAILHIACFPKPLADAQTIKEIFRLTKIAFGKKRKMLRNTIGELESGMERLACASIDPTRRPQTLTIEEWIQLCHPRKLLDPFPSLPYPLRDG